MTETARRQRVDQWLWHARLIKTRTLAARLVENGGVRINRVKVTKPGHQLKPGDVLSFVHANRLRVIEVVLLATRRGPAREAQTLFRDPTEPDCELSTDVDQKEGA